MKEIKKERTTTQTYYEYEALDGTIFTDKEECQKYEDSALCHLKSRVKRLIVTKEHNAWDLMGGYEDNSVLGLKFDSEVDVQAFIQYCIIIHPYLSKDTGKESLDEIIKKVDAAKNSHDILLVGIDCDDDYYVIDTVSNIVNRLHMLSTENELKEA